MPCLLYPPSGTKNLASGHIFSPAFCSHETVPLTRVAGPSGLGELTSRLEEEEEEEQICPAPGGPFSALQARQILKKGEQKVVVISLKTDFTVWGSCDSLAMSASPLVSNV
jgi:hypothetical protein